MIYYISHITFLKNERKINVFSWKIQINLQKGNI